MENLKGHISLQKSRSTGWFQYTTLILFSAITIAAMEGCSKEDLKVTPADHIRNSENLILPATIELPANLPAGNSRVATYFAEGVQKYKAQQKAGEPGKFEWVFVAPQANLYDSTNAKIGTHSAGPSWQLLSNADSIFAQQFSPPRTAPSTQAGAVDWLLLMPKAGKAPSGIFQHVAYIHRIATKGGKAPLQPPLSADETVEVNYTAIYRFIKKS